MVPRDFISLFIIYFCLINVNVKADDFQLRKFLLLMFAFVSAQVKYYKNYNLLLSSWTSAEPKRP